MKKNSRFTKDYVNATFRTSLFMQLLAGSSPRKNTSVLTEVSRKKLLIIMGLMSFTYSSALFSWCLSSGFAETTVCHQHSSGRYANFFGNKCN